MSVWVLCFQMLFLANRLIIGSLRSLEEVGIYASAYDLINGSLSLIITPFLLAAHPIMLQLWARTHERTVIEELIERIFRYLLLLFAPIFFFSLTINKELFFVLGRGFGIKGWVVPVLIAGVFCGGFSMYVHKGLEIAKRTGIMMGVAALTAFLNVTLNLSLVGQYGYAAAAVVALISYVFYMVVVYSFSRQYVRLRIPWKSVFRICVAGGSAGVCLWLVKHTMIITIIGSALTIGLSILLFSGIYLIMLIVSGELMAERQQFMAIVSRYRLNKITRKQTL
jgi:O-antigen/teichoic acid export membrane protein